MAALGTARTDFTDKMAKAASGGPPDTAAKNASRQALIGLLRSLATYVEGAPPNLQGAAAKRSTNLPKQPLWRRLLSSSPAVFQSTATKRCSRETLGAACRSLSWTR